MLSLVPILMVMRGLSREVGAFACEFPILHVGLTRNSTRGNIWRGKLVACSLRDTPRRRSGGCGYVRGGSRWPAVRGTRRKYVPVGSSAASMPPTVPRTAGHLLQPSSPALEEQKQPKPRTSKPASSPPGGLGVRRVDHGWSTTRLKDRMSSGGRSTPSPPGGDSFRSRSAKPRLRDSRKPECRQEGAAPCPSGGDSGRSRFHPCHGLRKIEA